MKKFTLAFLFILCSLATGCGKSSPGTIADAPPRIALPECGSTENCIYLYNRYSQKLLSYNVDAQTVEQQSNIVNYIQYEFNEAKNRYFTAGNSLTNGFAILSVDRKEITEVHRLADEKTKPCSLWRRTAGSIYSFGAIMTMMVWNRSALSRS